MNSLAESGKGFLKIALPFPARQWLRQMQRRLCHLLLPFRRVNNFQRWRRLTPISRDFGYLRGQCIDRYYIELFLAAHAGDIRGRVLEIQTNAYTRKFGGECVTSSEVLDLNPANPRATIVADLATAEQIASASFDCVLCTQTLLLIYDVRAAIRTLHRILKPGGVLLVTVPGVAHQICRQELETGGGDYWRFTSMSMRRLLEEVFAAPDLHIETFGNVLVATVFLHGMAAEELRRDELDYHDPDYEVTIAARAVKPGPGNEDGAGYEEQL